MKIGIITMFHNSSNYGGVLQAYALTKFLRNEGIIAEQICYNNFSAFSLKRRFFLLIKRVYLVGKSLKHLIIIFKICKRNKIFKINAKKIIPHSSKIYNERNIKNCNKIYDGFITGSDQVWHGEWPAYFLSFANSDKKKVAYSVSCGKNVLLQSDLTKIKRYALDFNAISVREIETQKQLQDLFPDRKIELLLDPTLLLNSNDWDEVTAPRKIKEKYIFCYFLGNDCKIRNLAKEYSDANSLILVSIPHMQNFIEKSDLNFGDVQLYDANIQDFLSYIKNAEMIFTDSFHASVFSLVFHKQFITFERIKHKEMNNRIETLMSLFNTKERFLHENQFSLNTIKNLESINYLTSFSDFEDRKKQSISFLKDNLL